MTAVIAAAMVTEKEAAAAAATMVAVRAAMMASLSGTKSNGRSMTRAIRCGSLGSKKAPSEPAMEPPFDLSTESDLESYSDSQLPEWSRHQVIEVTKCNDSYSTGPIRFKPNGDVHRVVISIEQEGGTRIRLIMDGVTIYEEETMGKFVGKVKLNIDGMVIDFLWLLNQVPVMFIFRKKAGYNDDNDTDSEDIRSCSVQIIGD
ncbi:hypothetical protein IEQ34_016471 [Dendrobium chrysotoxum]|uniref:Uncharacterized protein n=1 Tax=Dendrobium chrysotoxum TaxID=161865 RepID=A0AAV7GG61_DENCH|nr:hypothetical protein IEQ34_016471 [Dendrobium chrysotoxum]